MSAAPTPDVTLYTFTTPNGWPISILLEELKALYGAPSYEAIAMSIRDSDIGKVHNQVKSPWFLEINPNGRIPAITHNPTPTPESEPQRPFHVFETSAILLYLAAQYDKQHALSRDPVADPRGYSEELQWLFFTHGGVGPMQGQANHFNLYAPEKIPYAITRYLNETRRLYAVLESRLSTRDYLTGTYGLADIKTFPWVRIAPRTGVDLGDFPHLKAWVDRIEARPAVQAGLKVPTL